jgi:2'-5' RNA ligase
MHAAAQAVVVPVPEAEAAVAPWREKLDPGAALWMPAHITVLYPFAPSGGLTDEVLGSLQEICAQTPSIEVTFNQTGAFPGVIYLAPQPAEPLRALTRALVDRWPESPPYDGAFDEVIPHLTVAVGTDESVLLEARAALESELPFGARLTEAQVFTLEGGRWTQRARLPFGGD